MTVFCGLITPQRKQGQWIDNTWEGRQEKGFKAEFVQSDCRIILKYIPTSCLPISFLIFRLSCENFSLVASKIIDWNRELLDTFSSQFRGNIESPFNPATHTHPRRTNTQTLIHSHTQPHTPSILDSQHRATRGCMSKCKVLCHKKKTGCTGEEKGGAGSGVMAVKSAACRSRKKTARGKKKVTFARRCCWQPF